MEITGDKLIEMFHTSATDDEMVEIIDTLGLEQPLLDEDYEFYEETSTIGREKVGIDLTFYDLKDCPDKTTPCLDKISYYNDNTISLPLGLKFSFSYNNFCKKLEKKADYRDKRKGKSKMWIIDNKYLLFVHFKTEILDTIRSIVILNYSDDKITNKYIPNKD